MDANRYIVFNNKKYAFDINKIKSFCLVSDKEVTKENEVLENYEIEDGATTLISKTSRTLKNAGNPQNDTIVYDLMKLFITTLLTNETPALPGKLSEEINIDIGTALALNTMLDMEFLYEIE